MAWHGHLFKHGFCDRNNDQLMELEMLDMSNSPAKAMDGDSKWQDENENEKLKPSWVMLG